MTGSGAMLAETLHSAADCVNQLLLLLGVKRAQRPADDTHPLGYGRALYFWSFIVALLLFSGGGVFSLYEGVHKLRQPDAEGPGNLWWGIGILGGSILLESAATFSNIKELNRRRGELGFFRFLRQTKDSDLVVIFGENAAATLSLVFALAALVITKLTGNPTWDAIGTLFIGAVLVAVALFLSVEIKSLLVGEAAAPEFAQTARELARQQPHFQSLLELITVQQGPGEVLMVLKVRFTSDISANEVVEEINAFEVALRERHPEVRWCFVEPDLPDDEPAVPAPGLSDDERAALLVLARETPGVEDVLEMVSLRRADRLMLALKVRFPQGVRVEEVAAIIDNLERRIRDAHDAVGSIWVEAASE
jgi:cation diffusion facilitator family transporter